MSKVISYDLASEVVKRLEDAGMTFDVAEEIVGSRGNKKAKAMMATFNGQEASVVKQEEPADPFKLLTEFEVVVPEGFEHATCLATFKKEHEKEFYYFNPAFTDANFAKATTKLASGRKFKVKVFGFKEVSSEQYLEKVSKEKGILVGAQGLTLAYLQGKDKLIKGKWHLSFDEREALPYLHGNHRVPYVGAGSDGDFDANLSGWDGDWGGRCCLLVFCDSE